MIVSRFRLAVVLVATAALAVAGTLALTRDRGVPRILRGEVRGVIADGAAVAIRVDGRPYTSAGEGDGFVTVGKMPWTGADGSHNLGGEPPCLQVGKRLEFGLLDVRGDGEWYPQAVVWVRCL